MNCTLKKIRGQVYVCTNRGCGRILKIERAKPSDATFATLPCAGASDDAEIDPELVARAERLGAMKVDKGVEKLTGPGTEFRKMADEAGFSQNGCTCAATEARMNQLGVEGCRREFDSLCDEIITNAKKHGIDLTIIVCDLVREAIRRAEQSTASA
jgi:hypothetical protein